MAAPITSPPSKSQKPLAAKPEKMTSCGTTSMARNAKKIRIAVVVSGRLRVAKDVIPPMEIAKTRKDGSDVDMIVANAAKATRNAQPCDVVGFGRLPIKTNHHYLPQVQYRHRAQQKPAKICDAVREGVTPYRQYRGRPRIQPRCRSLAGQAPSFCHRDPTPHRTSAS